MLVYRISEDLTAVVLQAIIVSPELDEQLVNHW
jgi:hypothetical protein